jgi:hypothetical protein
MRALTQLTVLICNPLSRSGKVKSTHQFDGDVSESPDGESNRRDLGGKLSNPFFHGVAECFLRFLLLNLDLIEFKTRVSTMNR